ncbi:MAG: hypothetical protein R2830_14515 [Saprospiraceae bacterium]
MMRTIAILFLTLCAHLHSQPQGSSTRLSVNEGLSQGMVFGILPTRDGFRRPLPALKSFHLNHSIPLPLPTMRCTASLKAAKAGFGKNQRLCTLLAFFPLIETILSQLPDKFVDGFQNIFNTDR